MIAIFLVLLLVWACIAGHISPMTGLTYLIGLVFAAYLVLQALEHFQYDDEDWQGGVCYYNECLS